MQENIIIDRRQHDEDEIDIRELFYTLWKKRVFILVVTSIVTTLAMVYTFFKNQIPIYSGNVMVEVGVGVGVGKYKSQLYLDNTNNLKWIVEKNFNVSVNIPKKTDNILLISSSSVNKREIVNTLKSAVSFIMNKHTEKLKLYDKYIMTKQVGEVKLDNIPINKPKKKLIVVVAFITGLILSIFLVFFLEFVKSFKKEEFGD